MGKGPILTACVAIVAFGAVLAAFSQNASPYVTLAQAKQLSGDHLHIAGDIVKNTVHLDPIHRSLDFDMKDADGALVHVVHKGELPANIQEANKVVAIGGMEGQDFISQQLLVKCPSKYEANPSGKVAQN